jgi:hypothetical protein
MFLLISAVLNIVLLDLNQVLISKKRDLYSVPLTQLCLEHLLICGYSGSTKFNIFYIFIYILITNIFKMKDGLIIALSIIAILLTVYLLRFFSPNTTASSTTASSTTASSTAASAAKTCALLRSQDVYTGCGFTYQSKANRDSECGSGGTSKWIGDSLPNGGCNLIRGQEVYTGCGFTYGDKSSRDTQCGSGGTSKWIPSE